MEIMVREAVRALLVTPERKLLLVQIENKESQWKGWILPGGGIDSGESHQGALMRELWEELGLRIEANPIPVAIRRKRFPWQGKIFDQIDNIYFIHQAEFIPRPKTSDASELENLQNFRWWSVPEMEAAQGETFAPRDLAARFEGLFSTGMPSRPLDWSD